MQVLKELEANKKLVLSLGLTPPSLPQLVEHNPAIAFEVQPPEHPKCWLYDQMEASFPMQSNMSAFQGFLPICHRIFPELQLC